MFAVEDPKTHIRGGLTRLFRALDRDQDGYLLVSDVALLGRVRLGMAVGERQAKEELQKAKAAAEQRIGSKKTFQPDALCLEEFIACSWFLHKVPEEEFEATIQDYIEAIDRITGSISQRELIMLKKARDQYRGAREDAVRTTGEDNAHVDTPSKRDGDKVDMIKMRSARSLLS